jgi:predicted NAD/FAD-dependent oxidoreductase
MLVGVLPTIVPIYEYTFRFDILTAGFSEAVLIDSVTDLTHSTDHYLIQTRGGETFTADNVVIATPIDISARFIDLGTIKSPIHARMYLVKGSLRRSWARATFSLFPEGDDTFAIAQQAGGQVLVVSALEQPDLSRFFDEWEVVEHHHWNPAFHLSGTTLLECEQGQGLYLVGDHNVCTLEDAYITGVYAAKRILAG